ncbi:hypothetical protein NW762_008350 [Fusarium torreyae]|uniref:Uncharacterized protein n=1 Tax=Fusarium torreyae TaxID=1237075 RepID=A0A9W8RXN6_9HYPO|nr:hypothetical protein NW762_008350 [Fusarium torreyae]
MSSASARGSGSGSNTEIFAPADVAQLLSLGLAGPLNQARGTRRVHKRRLNRSSDEENGHIPLNAHPQSQPEAFATIPADLISNATIEYVGFAPDKATQIWNSWNNWPTTGPQREIDHVDNDLQVTFLDFLKGHVSYSADTFEDNDPAWIRYMQNWGIPTELQHSIMDGHFKSLRLDGSCAYWVRDTIKMRYAGFEDIQRASRERQQALQRASSRPGPSPGRGSGSGPSASSASASQSIPGIQRDSLPGSSLDSCSSRCSL